MQKQLANADGVFLMVLTVSKYIIDNSLQLMSFKIMIKNTICRIGVV